MMQKDPYSILGFRFNPFPAGSSTKGYFFTPLIRQILDELYFGILSRKGIMVLVGEVGVGKTSLLLQLLSKLEKEKDLKVSWVFNTFLPPKDILKAIAIDFGIKPERDDISFLIEDLYKFFIETNKEGGNCAIIIDEAHNLSEESLETLRMLSNLESDGQKLVQIILAGQSELKFILSESRFRQLRSRIQIFNVLTPFSKEETINYINYKLAVSGAQITISKKALSLVYQFSLGNIRMIHLIMDRAVHILVTKGSFHISSKVIKLAVKDVASFQEPIKKELEKFYKKRVLKIFLGFGIFILIILGGFFYFQPSFSKLTFKVLTSKTFFSEKINKPDKVKEKESKKVSLEGFYKSYIDTFLNSFGLGSLKPYLIEALKNKDFSIFISKLPSPYEVLLINSIPPRGYIKFSIFPWEKICNSNPKYLLLWKPPIKIDKFFPNKSSKVDILVLQTMLKELGFYSQEPDGKFGPSTLDAVTLFQRKYNLPQTHGVDGLTLFWLCLEYEKFKIERKKREK